MKNLLFSIVFFSGLVYGITGQLILSNVEFNSNDNFGSGGEPLFLASPSYSITNNNIVDWNEAYNWGNHALAGYLTSETESLFVNSPAYNILNSNISDWSAAFSWGNHAIVGYASIAYVDNSNTVLKEYVDSNFLLKQNLLNENLNIVSGKITANQNGNVSQVIPIVSLYNKANAASMAGTGQSISFYQNYNVNSQPVEIGNIQYSTVGNWTVTSGTQTADFKIRRRGAGVMSDVMHLDGNTLRFPNVYAFAFGGTDSSSYPYSSIHIRAPQVGSVPTYTQSMGGFLLNTTIITTESYRMYNDFVTSTGSTGSTGGGGFRFFTQPRSAGNPLLALTIDENQASTFSGNVNISGSLTVGGYLINPNAGVNMNGINLESLADVDITNPEENQVLQWNGNSWKNKTIAVDSCNCNFYVDNSNVNSLTANYINDIELFKTNQSLAESDFPDSDNHNGNLYIFKANTSNGGFTTTYGGVSLITTNNPLLAIDHLGNTAYTNMNGTYMRYDSANLAGAGMHSISATVKRDSWAAPINSQAIISDWDDTDGSWSLEQNELGEIAFYMLNNNTKTKLSAYPVTNLDTTLWHRIQHVFAPNNFSMLYIDGLLTSAAYHNFNPNHDPNNFQISGINGNNYLWEDYISEISLQRYIHNSGDISKIALRGSKQIASMSANGYPVFSKYNDDIVIVNSDETLQSSPDASTNYEVNPALRLPLRKGIWHVTFSGTDYFSLSSEGQGISQVFLSSLDSSINSLYRNTFYVNYAVMDTGYHQFNIDFGNIVVPSDTIFRIMSRWIIKAGTPSANNIGLSGTGAPLILRAVKINE
jgi:hypothetical protein